MYGIAIDLYESIMYMQLITSDEYINIYIFRELFSDRFTYIHVHRVINNGKTQFCCI